MYIAVPVHGTWMGWVWFSALSTNSDNIHFHQNVLYVKLLNNNDFIYKDPVILISILLC